MVLLSNLLLVLAALLVWTQVSGEKDDLWLWVRKGWLVCRSRNISPENSKGKSGARQPGAKTGVSETASAGGSRAAVESLLARSGVRIRYGEYLLLSAGGVLLGTLVGFYLNNWLISVMCGYLGYKIPERALMYLQEKRKVLLAKQMEPALQQIANLYRITQSMESALEQSVISMAPPLKGEFLQMLSDIRVAGMTMEEALARLADRLDLRDFDFFVKIALLTQKYGGETKELMLQIPQTIRERQMIRAELETEIAGAKQQAWILLAGTPIFFIIYKVLRPDFAAILTETAQGKIGMAIVALLSLISIYLFEKITRPVI